MINCSDEIKTFLEADAWFAMSEHNIASALKWKITNMVSSSEPTLILQIITCEDLRSEYSE
jgi:hypothetical protein